MAKNITPKHCHVAGIELDGKGNAELRLSCPRNPSDFLSQPEYHSRNLRGIRSVHLNEGTVSGAAKMGFVVSPDWVTCARDGIALRCKRRTRR